MLPELIAFLYSIRAFLAILRICFISSSYDRIPKLNSISGFSNNNSVSYGDTNEGSYERAKRFNDGKTEGLPPLPQVTTTKGAPTTYGTFDLGQGDSTISIMDLMQ